MPTAVLAILRRRSKPAKGHGRPISRLLPYGQATGLIQAEGLQAISRGGARSLHPRCAGGEKERTPEGSQRLPLALIEKR
ncbi:MAG: hypothetical protein L0387_00595, partial [Acidobacteria bacterium]|nr:hypothetical protein [Acidobacteriota bacterium]